MGSCIRNLGNLIKKPLFAVCLPYARRIIAVSTPYQVRINSPSHPYQTRITPVSSPYRKPLARYAAWVMSVGSSVHRLFGTDTHPHLPRRCICASETKIFPSQSHPSHQSNNSQFRLIYTGSAAPDPAGT